MRKNEMNNWITGEKQIGGQLRGRLGIATIRPAFLIPPNTCKKAKLRFMCTVQQHLNNTSDGHQLVMKHFFPSADT